MSAPSLVSDILHILLLHLRFSLLAISAPSSVLPSPLLSYCAMPPSRRNLRSRSPRDPPVRCAKCDIRITNDMFTMTNPLAIRLKLASSKLEYRNCQLNLDIDDSKVKDSDEEFSAYIDICVQCAGTLNSQMSQLQNTLRRRRDQLDFRQQDLSHQIIVRDLQTQVSKFERAYVNNQYLALSLIKLQIWDKLRHR